MSDTTQLGPALDDDKHRELRSSVRFKVENVTPVVYEKGLLAQFGIGCVNRAREAINLSTGGLLVRTSDRIAKGTKVGVHLEVEKFNDVIEAEGVVRWCFQAAKDSRHFYAGIQFTKISKGDTQKIAQLQGYFTSPEYKQKTARRKLKDPLQIDR
jgi:Tfp pilus assembly protein PilZ